MGKPPSFTCPSSVGKYKKNSYALITFEGSPEVFVKNINDIKIVNGINILKWRGSSYEVSILSVQKQETVLRNIARNLNCGWPKVSLTRYSTYGNQESMILSKQKVGYSEHSTKKVLNRSQCLQISSSPPLIQAPSSLTPQTPSSLQFRASCSLTPLQASSSLTPLQAPSSLTPLQAPSSLTPLQDPSSLTPLQAPSSLTPLQAPSSLTPLQAPSSLTPLQAPSSLTPLQAPSSLTPLQAPSSLTPLQAPSSLTPLQAASSFAPLQVQSSHVSLQARSGIVSQVPSSLASLRVPSSPQLQEPSNIQLQDPSDSQLLPTGIVLPKVYHTFEEAYMAYSDMYTKEDIPSCNNSKKTNSFEVMDISNIHSTSDYYQTPSIIYNQNLSSTSTAVSDNYDVYGDYYQTPSIIYNQNLSSTSTAVSDNYDVYDIPSCNNSKKTNSLEVMDISNIHSTSIVVGDYYQIPSTIYNQNLPSTITAASDNCLTPFTIYNQNLSSTSTAISDNYDVHDMDVGGSHLEAPQTMNSLGATSYLFNVHSVSDVNVDEESDINVNIETEDVSSEVAKAQVKRKQHCCLYCGLMAVTIPRHLIRKHAQEEQVQLALSYDKNSEQRRKCLDNIRKQGDFKYNKRSAGDDIVVRNSCKPLQTAYLPCIHCSGSYSVKNLRHHIRKYCPRNSKSQRNLLGLSVVKGSYIHPLACENLKTLIYPTLRQPDTFKLVTSDVTAVMYANRLAGTYLVLSHHHTKMIASQLRLLSKIFLAMKHLDPTLTEIKDIFYPNKYDCVVQAIRSIAGFDGKRYRTPTVVHQSCTLLKKVADFVKTLKIKESNKEGVKAVEHFTFLLTTNQNSDLAKVATETRTRHQRTKKEILPTTSEVHSLIKLLETDIDHYYKLLNHKFNKEFWIKLSNLTLVYILVFNRKRPGDVQRTEIVEYQTISTVTEEDSKHLSIKEKLQASNFARYVARGKLNRSASILLSNKVRAAIDLLLINREAAKVDKENVYLFADPSYKNSFYEANIALKKYCATKKIPASKFTATKLRKHLATSTATLPKDTQAVISDFMGHGQEIHNNIYKHRDAYIDIITMGRVLTDASGFTKRLLYEAPPVQKEADVPEWLDSSESDVSSMSDLENVHSLEFKESNQRAAIRNCRKKLSVILESNEDSHLDTSITANKCSNNTEIVSPLALCSTSKVSIASSPLENRRSPLSYASSTPLSPTISEHSSISSLDSEYERRPVSKRTWSTPERQSIKECFSDYFEKHEVPNLREIQNRKITTELKDVSRSLVNIQNWIRAEIQRNKRGKRGWTTPQKVKCREYFSKYYNKTESSVYPSVQVMKEAVETVPEFEGKTVETLRSHLQHDFLYLSKKG